MLAEDHFINYENEATLFFFCFPYEEVDLIFHVLDSLSMRSGLWVNWDYHHSNNGERRWALLYSNSCNLLIQIGETLGTLKSGCKKRDLASKVIEFEHPSEYL